MLVSMVRPVAFFHPFLTDAWPLVDAVFIDTRGDINIYFKESTTSACCAPSEGQECCAGMSGPTSASRLHRDFDANAWVGELHFFKPDLLSRLMSPKLRIKFMP